MSEDKKPTIEHRAPVREFDNTTHLVTRIKDPLNPMQKFEIILPVPKTDEEAKERYDCDLATLIQAGVRNFATRVVYHSDTTFVGSGEGKDFEITGYINDSVDKTHELMQEAADCYRVGSQRSGGPTQKALAAQKKKDDAKLAAAGLESMDDVLALAREMGLVPETAEPTEAE